MWESFKCQLIGIQDRHVPERMKDKCGNYQEPWITRDIMSLAKKKKEALVRSKRLRTDEALEEYKECRKELKEGVRRVKRGHE